MPKCADCRMLAGNRCKAWDVAFETFDRTLPPHPYGGCVVPIVEDYLPSIKTGMRVLDIGCGTWGLIKAHCENVGAKYEAIDVERYYYGKKSICTRLENLSDLSFPDDSFDVIIGNQSMEHWAENGCSLEWGLYQCFRVCRTNGRVLLNVPIHFHGTKTFLTGDHRSLQGLFARYSKNVSWTEWGRPSDPLPSFYAHPGYRRLRSKPAYVLDIQAVKDRATEYAGTSKRGHRSYLLKRLSIYPLSYNLYLAARKYLGK
jgi:SAM-dependent methyltransferase